MKPILPQPPPAIEIQAEPRKNNLDHKAAMVLLETAILEMRKFRKLLSKAVGRMEEKEVSSSEHAQTPQGNQSDDDSLV